MTIKSIVSFLKEFPADYANGFRIARLQQRLVQIESHLAAEVHVTSNFGTKDGDEIKAQIKCLNTSPIAVDINPKMDLSPITKALKEAKKNPEAARAICEKLDGAVERAIFDRCRHTRYEPEFILGLLVNYVFFWKELLSMVAEDLRSGERVIVNGKVKWNFHNE